MVESKEPEFLNKLREELRPSNLVLKEVDVFLRKINNLLKKNKIKAKCVKGGSTAKGTFLKGDHDVDLFVIFDHEYKGKDISKILQKTITPIKVDVIHGSRDYFQFKKNKITYEIVPVLEVKNVSKIENVTDMSPQHVDWVKKRLSTKLCDDIRLAKKFCKAQKVYGAESYISGFSGHALDILIIHYGSFLKWLKSAKDWKHKVVIDIEKHHKNPLKSLDKSKTLGPILIVDPVQNDRNAAAAVSQEKFEIFIKAATKFLINPNKNFFIESEFDIEKIKKKTKEASLIVIDIKSLEGKMDIVGAKLLKIHDFVKKQLSEFDFTLADSDWKWDKKEDCQMYFLVKEKLLSKTFVRTGPPLKQKKACIDFKKKNNEVFERDDRLYADIIRNYRKSKELIKNIIKDDYIKNKVEEIKIR